MYHPIGLVALFAICSQVSSIQENALIAQTKFGSVRGKLTMLASGKQVQTFLGIPYAKPPVGNLRFQYPIDPDKWDEVLDATNYSKSCSQVSLSFFKSVKGFELLAPLTDFSEDCLYLNVFTPNPRPKMAPVVVFIHGGMFAVGSAAMLALEPYHLVADEDVIFVNMNYRLGALGLLTLDNPGVKANLQLMDQAFALQWVQDNIRNFGGDPSKVTLMGQSSGSVDVGMHMFSPISRDLFHRVILESGFPNVKFVMDDRKYMVKLSNQLVENMGCSNDNSTAELQCLLKPEASEITANEPRPDYDVICFFPVVDGHFLNEEPADLIKQQDFKSFDILHGVNKNDGILPLVVTDPILFNPSSKQPTLTPEDSLKLMTKVLARDNEFVHKAVLKHYKKGNTPLQILHDLDELVTDYLFVCPGKEMTNAHLKKGGKVFAYSFEHRSKISWFPEWFGVIHGEELAYTLGYVSEPDSNYNEEDKILAKRMRRYFANFAKTGNPNLSSSTDDLQKNLIHWPESNLNHTMNLVLAPNSNRSIEDFKKDDCRFWDKTIPNIRLANINNTFK